MKLFHKHKTQEPTNRITAKKVTRYKVIPCCVKFKEIWDEHILYYSENDCIFSLFTNDDTELHNLFIPINYCPWCGASLNVRTELPDLREIT